MSKYDSTHRHVSRCHSAASAAFFMLLSAVSAFGGDANWVGGSGCISSDFTPSSTGWQYSGGATTPLYSTDDFTFVHFQGDNKDYTVTLDKDMDVAIVSQTARNQTLRLNFWPYTFKTENGEGWQLNGENSTVRLESGTLSVDESFGIMPKRDGFTFVADGPTAIVDGRINLRDASGVTVIVTNGAKVAKGIDVNGLCNNRVLVSGEGTLVDYMEKDFNVGGTHLEGDIKSGNKIVTNNYYLVHNGAVVTNALWGVRCGYFGSWSMLDVDGGKVYGKEIYIGYSPYSSNNVLRLSHDGRVLMTDTKYICVGTSENSDPATCGNTLLYEDYEGDRELDYGFRMGSAQDWEVDHGRGASNNTVRIVRSTLDLAPDKVHFTSMGGANNGIVVSEGSHVRICATADGRPAEGGTIGIGEQNSAHGNYMITEGDGTTVSNFNSNSGTRIGYRNSRGCRFEVREGGEFYGAKDIRVGSWDDFQESGEHLLRVASNGRFLVPDGNVVLGHNPSNGNFASNRIEVVDGGYMEALRLRFYGDGNSLLVSNATLRIRDEFVSPHDGMGSNTSITFAGKTPHLEVGGANWFYQSTKLRFVVPRGGYETVPFERTSADGKIDFASDDTEFEFDIEGLNKSGGGKMILMRAPGGVSMNDGQVAKMRENLPKGCKLYFSKNTETLARSPDEDRASCTMLVLETPRHGMVIILK